MSKSDFYSAQFVAVVSLLILNGCGHGNIPLTVAPTPNNENKAPIQPEKKSTSNFALQLSPQPKPNSYFVKVDWEQSFNEKKIWFINRTDERTKRTEVFTVPAGQRTFTDEKTESNTNYVYAIGTSESSDFQELHRQTIKIPVDFEIDMERTLEKITGYNRLFLGKNCNLHSSGEPIEIEINELIAQTGATIEPFNPNIPTPIGQNGKDGAMISIKAKKAQGSLKISLKGTVGGQGLKGTTGAQGAKGTKGADCNPKAPEGKQHAMGGEMGGPGHPGQQGYRGGTGGKNSPVHIEIGLSENFQLSLDQTPAAGGMGGEAGNGGPGGAGGEPGNAPNHPSGMCHWKSAPQGPQGPPGPNGQPGPRGDDGQRNSICIKMNGRTEGACQ